jgi:hypothetical protein
LTVSRFASCTPTRAPVGGIFRHILDLANGQADRGHHVGIIADSLTGGERAEQALAEIAPASSSAFTARPFAASRFRAIFWYGPDSSA